MWWEFHRLMDLTAGAARRRGRPDRSARTRRAARGDARGQAGPGATDIPTQELDLGRGSALRPRPQGGRPGRQARATWAIGELVAVEPVEPDRRHQARPDRRPAPARDRAARPWSRPTTTRRDSSSSANGSRSTASMPTGPWRAARDLLLGRPPRAGQAAGAPLRRPGRDRCSTRRGASRSRSTRRCSPIQGPPGSGKTYTGARMICALLARRASGSASPATSHKVIGNLLRAVLDGGRQRTRASTVRADPATATPDQVHRRPARDPGQATPSDVATRLATAGANLVGGTAWLWASPKMRRRGGRAVRRRGRADLARQRRRDVAAPPTASCCSAIRSSSTSRCRAPIRPAPTARRSRTCSATHATIAAGPRAVPRDDVAAPPGPVRRSRPRCSTTTGSSPRPTSPSSA